MGNRILKESICMNRKFDELNDFEETVFCRLIVKVDDYGIFLADPDVLTSMLYPWKRTLDPAVVGQAVRRMEELGMVMTYTVDGEKYLKITSWEKHQKMRSRVHRFPTPQDSSRVEGCGGSRVEGIYGCAGRIGGGEPGNARGGAAPERQQRIRRHKERDQRIRGALSRGGRGAGAAEHGRLVPGQSAAAEDAGGDPAVHHQLACAGAGPERERTGAASGEPLYPDGSR